MGTREGVMSPPVWGLLGCCFLCSWALESPQPLLSLPPLSSQAQPGSVPKWVPSEGADAALAFLYSGDAKQLLGANCSERYEALGSGAKAALPPVLHRAAGTLAQAANFLNMLLQANDIRESSVEEDVEWYQALVRSVAEGDPRAYRAVLTFSPPPGASHLQLALQATRLQEETFLQDLSGSRVQEESLAGDLDDPALQKRVLTNDLGSLNSPKWRRGDGYVGDMQHVRLSPPFLECHQGQLRPGWLITLSAAFYGLKPDLSPEVRGQVQMDVDLQSVDINQCATGPGWYSNTHLCDLNSTQCIPLESQGFVLGRYLCRCRPGFYKASHSGGLEWSATQPTGQFGSPQGSSRRLLQCQPCPEGCTSCMDGTPCLVEAARTLRAAVLACQACCMLAVFLSMLVAYRCRRSKRIRASGVILLETILFGSLLLYFPVFILYFKPSVFRCIALRWVRLLGFVIVYGTIILKLYRVLQLFLSRSAQRGPHLSSRRLLRRLGLLLLLVLGFLVLWTAGVLEPGIQQTLLVTRGHTTTGHHFYLCQHDRWDYIMVVAEMLLLCWGSFLCYATRAVPSAFHEPRYMGIALHNELLLSAAFHAARFVLVPSLHPSWTLLLFFFHTHSTVTATLALLFIPKFWKPGAPPREEMIEEVYEEELDLQHSGSYFDSSIASAWSEHSLDPGDIRDELKKLYAQLEVQKTKEMTANNPHLPKKRGSSCQGLGRSFIKYLTEFPEALARQHSRQSGSTGHSSLPGSSRRQLLSSNHQEPEGPPTLRKSHSTYDHHRKEQDPPLLDSVLRRKLAKKVSKTESRDSYKSVEGPPVLSFRSASAHNLTVVERLPRARPTSLQKSLSVVTDSREKALLVASQAYLEETYQQAKEREERKKAEVAAVSPGRRPSSRRLGRAWGAPLSAPPSPAKSICSMDSSHTSRQLHEESGKWLPHLPIRHQVSTPILTLPGACLGEPRMLSPTSTLAPALIPAPVPPPIPTLAPVPALPQGPNLLTYICPWENAELPVKKENVPQEGLSGPERGGSHSPAPARARIWRALSVAVERMGAGENEMDPGNGALHGEAEDVDEDKPKTFSKSHSLVGPVQQGSMRSLGLAIKALTRSRSTYREKESGEKSPERGDKGKASGEGVGAPPRSPRVGRPRAMSKQAALSPCDDEESFQNQQNAHTSRMLLVCHQEGSREQDRGRRTAQGLGDRKAEKEDKTGPAALRQGRQGTAGEKHGEGAKEVPGGWREQPKAGLQPLGSADHKVAEVCPWEVVISEVGPLDSSNKAEVCPWEVSEETPERGVLRQALDSSQEERGKASEKPEPKDVAASARKKPERLVRGQEAVCPWEGTDPGGLSPLPAPHNTDRTKDKFEVVDSVETREAATCRWEATGPEVYKADMAKTELCPWEANEGGKDAKPTQEAEKELPQETQKTPRKAIFWKEQKLSRDWNSLCPWERTDFLGPSPISTQASGTLEHTVSLGSSVTEWCPQEVGGAPATRKAEVCPWELDAEITGKETASQGTGGESLQEKGKASRIGSSGEMRAQAVKTGQKVSQQQEPTCDQESIAPGHSSPCADSSSPKARDELQSTGGSRVTQVCPWEDSKPEVKEAIPAKAEICPWDVNDRTEDWSLGQAPKGSESQKVPEKMPGIKKADITAQEDSKEQTPKQAAVCSQERGDHGALPPQPGSQGRDKPKDGFQMSGSGGNKTAEICPWGTEETLTAEKASICPWEVSAGAVQERTLGEEAIGKSPGDTGKPSTDSGTCEKAATAANKPEGPDREQEVACPWGSLDPGGSFQHSHVLDPDTTKAGPQDLDSMGCRAADVCPWEVEEAPTIKKAEICPWEVNEGAIEKGLEQELGSEPAGQREKTLERGKPTSLGEDISKWEAKSRQEREAVCPWGNMDLGEPSAQAPEVSVLSSSMSSKVAEGSSLTVRDEAEHGGLRQDPKGSSLPGHVLTQEKAAGLRVEVTTEDGENMSKDLQSVCPWDSSAAGGLVSYPDTQCTDQLKTGSQGWASVGDRVTEVCPWDAPDSDVYKLDSSTKDDICPWEGSEGLPEKEVSRQNGKGESQEEKGKAPEKSEPKDVAVQKKPEKADRKQEVVCPWDSQDCGGPPPQPAPQPSDKSKDSSEAASSVGASVADMCPWEAEEAPSAKKAEICPWEMSQGAAEKGLAQEVDRDSQGQGQTFVHKAGSEGTEEHFSKAAAKLSREQETVCLAQDTDQTKVSPHEASSLVSRTAEIYRWEVIDPEGNKIKGTMAEICPWEGTGAPAEEPGLLSETETWTEMMVPTTKEKASCLSVYTPLGGFLPESKSLRPQVSRPDSTLTLECAREPQGLSGLRPEATCQEAEAPKSSSTEDQEESTSITQNKELTLTHVYPWDWE